MHSVETARQRRGLIAHLQHRRRASSNLWASRLETGMIRHPVMASGLPISTCFCVGEWIAGTYVFAIRSLYGVAVWQWHPIAVEKPHKNRRQLTYPPNRQLSVYFRASPPPTASYRNFMHKCLMQIKIFRPNHQWSPTFYEAILNETYYIMGLGVSNTSSSDKKFHDCLECHKVLRCWPGGGLVLACSSHTVSLKSQRSQRIRRTGNIIMWCMNIRALLHAMTINHNRRHHQYLINLIVDYVWESAIQSVAPGWPLALVASNFVVQRQYRSSIAFRSTSSKQ